METPHDARSCRKREEFRLVNRLQVEVGESARVSAAEFLGRLGTGGGTEPGNESLEGEGLGESTTVAVARSRGSSGGRLGGDSGRSRCNSGRLGRRSRGGSRGLRGNGGSRGLGGGRGRRRSGRRSRGGSSTTGSTVPDLGAGDGVAGWVVVEVEENAGVSGLVRTRDGYTSREVGRAGSADLHLDAAHVELSTGGTVTLVESNDLGTEEVLASGEASGESDAVLATVGDESLDRPFAAGQTLLGELDPDVALTVRASGCNVGQDGTLVGEIDDVVGGRVVVVVPLEGDLVSSLDVDGLSSRLGAADVAGHVLGGDIDDGAVVGRGADVATGRVTKTLVDIVDQDVVDGGVGRDHLESAGGSEGEEGSGLHFESGGFLCLVV